MPRALILALFCSLLSCGTDDKPTPPRWRGLDVGAACTGDGQCGEGTVELAGGMALCSSMPGGTNAQDSPEVCDEVDNDCNGVVDDLPDAPLADQQQGVCSGASQQCLAAGGFVEPDYTKITGYEADEQACDQLDNDCDGSTDEGCPDCSTADSYGLFPNCDACGSNCDQISSPTMRGYACGCQSSGDCPCGLVCGSIEIAPNVNVQACRRWLGLQCGRETSSMDSRRRGNDDTSLARPHCHPHSRTLAWAVVE